MFDRILNHEAAQRGNMAGKVFADQQAGFIADTNQAARQDAAETARVTNREKLDQLEETGQFLGVAAMVDELNSFDSFAKTPLNCRTISWMPHAPATIDQNASVIDGVKAVHGWIIAPENGKPHRLAAFVGLSDHKQDDTYSLPRLSVTPLHYPAGEQRVHVSIEEILTRDSRTGVEWLRLQAIKEQKLKTWNPSHRNVLTTYYHDVKTLTDETARHNPDSMLTVLFINWQMGYLDGPYYGKGYPISEIAPRVLSANHIKMANQAMELIHKEGFSPKTGQISPDFLAKDRIIYESDMTLASVQALFAPARCAVPQKFKFFRKTSASAQDATPAGILAEGSPVHDSQHARIETADRLEALYSKAIGA